MSLETVSHRFRAMGTDVSLIAGTDASPEAFAIAAATVELTFGREERRFSRFRADSELSRVNAWAGRWTTVSPAFANLTRYALDAARSSNGRFDPTVLPALVAAGYDRNFDEVIAGARGRLHAPSPCGRWREVELVGERLRLPSGVGLDFGGVAKGWTVDLAAEAAVNEAGLSWAVVNAGGDLRALGRVPHVGIEVGIEDPYDRDQEAMRLTLFGGALATSCIATRSWGPELHHLIDPRTGVPASTGVLQATAWGQTCAEAEIGAKTALLEGPAALEHLSAVLITDDRVLTNLEPAARVGVGA